MFRKQLATKKELGREDDAPMETAPTQPCPSRPALRRNCQMYPLPFTSQCGALGSAIEQAIGIDTSHESMSCVGRLSKERGPGGRCAAEQFPIDCPAHQHNQNPRFSSLGAQSILTFSIDPNSSTPPTRINQERSSNQSRC